MVTVSKILMTVFMAQAAVQQNQGSPHNQGWCNINIQERNCSSHSENHRLKASILCLDISIFTLIYGVIIKTKTVRRLKSQGKPVRTVCGYRCFSCTVSVLGCDWAMTSSLGSLCAVPHSATGWRHCQWQTCGRNHHLWGQGSRLWQWRTAQCPGRLYSTRPEAEDGDTE